MVQAEKFLERQHGETKGEAAAARGGGNPKDRKTGNTWTEQSVEFQPQETFVSVSTAALALPRFQEQSGASVRAGSGEQHV